MYFFNHCIFCIFSTLGFPNNYTIIINLGFPNNKILLSLGPNSFLQKLRYVIIHEEFLYRCHLFYPFLIRYYFVIYNNFNFEIISNFLKLKFIFNIRHFFRFLFVNIKIILIIKPRKSIVIWPLNNCKFYCLKN